MQVLLPRVCQFLFIPESELSVVFLCLFVLAFIYGIYRLAICSKVIRVLDKEAVRRFEPYEGRMNLDTFIELLQKEFNAREIRVNEMSHFFIMLGIFGTFLGLGIAIHGAADLLSGEKVELVKLNGVLGVIAFKFQTSVWGTIFSLLYVKIFLEPYFVKKANAFLRIRRTLELRVDNTQEIFTKKMNEINQKNKGENIL